jgi:hypothetical protein
MPSLKLKGYKTKTLSITQQKSTKGVIAMLNATIGEKNDRVTALAAQHLQGITKFISEK